MLRVVVCILVLVSVSVSDLMAEDWPQWMGTNRDGVWNEKGISRSFKDGKAKVDWRIPVGKGYAGPAVVGDRVLVFDYQVKSGEAVNNPGSRTVLQGQERVLCLDASTGKELWKYEYDCPYEISYPNGPRCTPTIADGKVYSLGAEGYLSCLELNSGKKVWSKQLKQEYKCESPIWGFSGHPLVDGDKLICLVGGKGSIAVAFNKDTGKELWKALSASESGYCPPSIIEAGGVRQLIIWDADKINGLNPETGAVYWSEGLKPSYGMSIMAPQQSGDTLYAAGIGFVGATLTLDAKKPGAKIAKMLDKKKAVFPSNVTPLIYEGTVFGCDAEQGALMAVDLKSGDRLWESFAPTTGGRRARHATAFLVRNEDYFYLMNDQGDLIISKLSSTGYEEKSRAHILEPTSEAFGRAVVWSHPAFAQKKCFARNDKEIICVDLAE